MIQLNWGPLTLEQAQGLVASYDVSYQPSDASGQVQSVSAAAGSRDFTINGLDASLGYTVSVAAVTAAGSGPPSSVTLQGLLHIACVPQYFVSIATVVICSNFYILISGALYCYEFIGCARPGGFMT